MTDLDLRTLCLQFLNADSDACLWGGTPDDFADAVDCDVMAHRFADFIHSRGREAEAVRVHMHAAKDGLGGGPHWFTVVDGIGIDWTARQFHNVRGVNVDAREIPSPLLFLWPGPYPLPALDAE